MTSAEASLLLVQPDGKAHGEFARLRRLLAEQEMHVEILAERAAHDAEADPGPAPHVILLPADLQDAPAVARALHGRWPRSELMFVQPQARVATFRRNLGLAPMLGRHWSIEALEAPSLMVRIRQAADAAVRRQRFRATLARANDQLRVSREEPVHRRALADHYLASFIDFSQDALVGLDLQGEVLFWSTGAADLTGVGADAAVGHDIREQGFWDPLLETAIGALREGGESRLVELTRALNGAILTLEVLCSRVRDGSGTLLGFSLLLRDVTAARLQVNASQHLLEEQYQHLYQLFHQAPGFVAVTGSPAHRIELANRAFHQLVTRPEVVGRPAAEVFPELKGQSVGELLDRVFATRRPFIGRGMPVKMRGGDAGRRRQRYLDFVFQPVLDAEGTPVGIFCQGHDVTAQVELREQLKRSEERLEALVEERTRELRRSQMALYQAQKLEAVGKLTGGVAHDFNNVLQIIGANLQLLRSGVAEDPRLLRRLDSANQAVDRGARLSAQLLAFARRQPLSPAPTNLGQQLRDMDELLRRALGEHIRLEVRVPPGLWTTLVDPHRLENVILNLAINSRDAMPQGGRLTLELANLRLQEEHTSGVGDLAPGHYVLLSVTDTGCGMPPDVVEQVFEPFFTTKPEGKGTGLGLSMAYGFAKQSGGHISLISEPGRGTTVTLYLPRTLQAVVATALAEQAGVEGGSETILVVEDDPDVQAAVIDQLLGLGYKVLRASDAHSALSILQSGINVDLLFTDVVMPGPLRSTELAERARALQPGIRVLFTSGYSQDAIIHDGRLDQGVELLSKPYRQEDLARRVRQLLDRQPPESGAGTFAS